MLTRVQLVAVIVCLAYVPQLTSASNRKIKLNKRMSKSEAFLRPKLFFKSEPTETTTVLHDRLVLSCEAGGIPNPTVHWLKNGERIQQGNSQTVRDEEASYEYNNDNSMIGLPKLQLANTVSKLYLDCITEDSEAVYSCVAETPYARKVQTHTVIVDSGRGSGRHTCTRQHKEIPARIYMYTDSRFEYENELTQLYCRAEGKPTPVITWYDPNNQPIANGDSYKIAKNGDLIILNASWQDHMGDFTCVADNGVGSDNTTTFLYPTLRS